MDLCFTRECRARWLPTQSGRTRCGQRILFHPSAYMLLTQADYAANFKTVDFAHAPEPVRAASTNGSKNRRTTRSRICLRGTYTRHAPGADQPITSRRLGESVRQDSNKARTSLLRGQDSQGPDAPHRQLCILRRRQLSDARTALQDGELSMVVMLPKDVGGLTASNKR